MRTKKITTLFMVALLAVSLTACEDTAASAATAVNKYAHTLSSFQDAEIKLHQAGRVSDETHAEILKAEKLAARAGQDLDQAILVAAKGGDPHQYIAVAKASLSELILAVKANDVNAAQEMILLLNAASAALDNAVSLIQQVKTSETPASTPTHLAFFLMALMPLAVVAGDGGTLGKAIKLLTLITTLEPIAFDLILNLARSLKGKSAEEIVTLNETIFSKVERVADEELEKLGDAGKEG